MMSQKVAAFDSLNTGYDKWVTSAADGAWLGAIVC